VDTEILDLLDNCNYRSISEISSVQACDICTLYWPFRVGMYQDETVDAVKNVVDIMSLLDGVA
jgi:hypothetical protein